MQTHLIHCSYHKCLTVYFSRVMHAVFNRCLLWSSGYQHFNSDVKAFYAALGQNRLSSVNNHLLDLQRLGDFRLTRFIRDPRDLLVSGYFYHRRGSEPWCTIDNPQAADWEHANGQIPAGLSAAGGSFAHYLQTVDKEQGLLAEMEFRSPHFDSMQGWPDQHEHILLFRYEDMPGRELEVFNAIFDHYGLSSLEQRLGRFFADRYSLARRSKKDRHIRNPSSGQWRQHFTPKIAAAFQERWGDLICQLGYPEN